MTDESLSDKRINLGYSYAYKQPDVKEFIKDVLIDCKIKWDKGNFVLANVQEIIKERAGDKLI